MSRPKFSALGVLYEALGFSVSKFSTVLRVAWLPMVLIIFFQVVSVDFLAQQGIVRPTSSGNEGGVLHQWGLTLLSQNWLVILVYLLPVVLQASFMVPLIAYAAHGYEPPRGSMQISFGLRHIHYIIVSFLSLSAVLLAARYLTNIGSLWAKKTISPVLQAQHGVFEPGSLHSIETEPAFGALNATVQQADQYLRGLGLNMGAMEAIVFFPVMLFAVYVMLRLFAWAPLVAAKTPGQTYRPLARSLAVSGGFNVFSLAAVLIAFNLIQILINYLLFSVGFPIFNLGAFGAETLIQGFDAFFPDGVAGPVIRAILSVLYVGIFIAAAAFIAGLTAGVSGAIVHRSIRNQ